MNSVRIRVEFRDHKAGRATSAIFDSTDQRIILDGHIFPGDLNILSRLVRVARDSGRGYDRPTPMSVA